MAASQLGRSSPFPLFMVILLAVASLILSIKYMYKSALEFRQYLRMYKKAVHASAHQLKKLHVNESGSNLKKNDN